MVITKETTDETSYKSLYKHLVKFRENCDIASAMKFRIHRTKGVDIERISEPGV